MREAAKSAGRRPTRAQRQWLRRGLDQPGGKLPLFVEDGGSQVSANLIRACIARGWAEPWFHNPLKPDWLVCRLTEAGRQVAGAAPGRSLDNRTDGAHSP
jgi:hypothetical protein